VGGRSSRMGTPKAALEWHGSTLLRRTLGVLTRSVTGPLVVVRAPGQPLPKVPSQVQVVDDPEEGLGPLQGVAAGLTALTGQAHAAFICSTDLPFLHPVFVRRVLCELADDVDVVLPVIRGYPQPLAAAYRITLAQRVSELVAAGNRRVTGLAQRSTTLRLNEAVLLADPTLATADPALDSVININSLDDYRTARRRPAPRVRVQCRGLVRSAGETDTLRAATLCRAAAAAGLTLDGPVLVTLNGDAISCDGDLPLVSGDTITITFGWAAASG